MGRPHRQHRSSCSASWLSPWKTRPFRMVSRWALSAVSSPSTGTSHAPRETPRARPSMRSEEWSSAHGPPATHNTLYHTYAYTTTTARETDKNREHRYCLDGSDERSVAVDRYGTLSVAMRALRQ